MAARYHKILSEFLNTSAQGRRLLPISGSIFAGKFHARMPAITAEALARCFLRLTAENQGNVMQRQLEMCIFMEAELADFQRVFGTDEGQDPNIQ